MTLNHTMFRTEFVKSDNQKFSAYWNELAASGEPRNPLYNITTTTNSLLPFEPKNLLKRTSIIEKLSSMANEGDFSFVLLENDEPILACSLLLTSDADGQRRLGYRGLGAATHFSRSALNSGSNNISSTSFATLTNYIRRLINKLEPDTIEFQDTLSCGVMSPISQYLIASGGLPIFSTARLLDLAASSQSLLRDTSMAVRGRIQWSHRNLQLTVNSDNLALYDYLKFYDLAQSSNTCETGVSLWQSNHDLKLLLQKKLGFLVSATHQGCQVGAAVFAYQNGAAQYLGCQTDSASLQKKIIASLVWRGVMHAKEAGCDELILDHHFDLCSQSLIDFDGFGGKSVPRVKVLWRKG